MERRNVGYYTSIALVTALLAACGCAPSSSSSVAATPATGKTAPDAKPSPLSAEPASPPAPSRPVAAPAADAQALAIFERRILPIFNSAKPSSCAECHLSGVDLKQYIRPTQQETFAGLVAAGLINREKPEQSKLLEFIDRRPERPSLMSDQIRREESAAFRAWIVAAVADPTLAATPAADKPLGSSLPPEVIRHARTDHVLTSFLENIWSESGRCAACHSPDKNQKQVREHGDRVSWIKSRNPQATLDHMIESGLIDPDDPANSLLLLKPTMQVTHGGGKKMEIGDRSYKQFRRFIDDYAAIVNGRYKSADDLPPAAGELSVSTEIWLKVTGVPAQFDKQFMQVDLYRVENGVAGGHRVATSDRAVAGERNLWQHSLSLVAPRGSAWAKEIESGKLPPGKYLIRIYVDQKGKLAKDFRAELADEDLVAEAEYNGSWPFGYAQMRSVPFQAR